MVDGTERPWHIHPRTYWHPYVLCFRWFLDDTEITGATTDTMSYKSIGHENNGKKLKCVATNSVGSGHIEHTLVVHCKSHHSYWIPLFLFDALPQDQQYDKW